MRRFVARQNIESLKRMLRSETDGARRLRLEHLLSEARHELDGLAGIWSWTCPHLQVPPSTGDAAETLLDELVEAQQAGFGSLQIWDEAGRCLRLMAHCNFDRSFADQFASVKDGDGTVCEAVQAAQAPVIIDDIENGDAFASLRSWTRTVGIRAIHTMPIFAASGDFAGAFSTHFTAPRGLTSDGDEMNRAYADRFGELFAALGSA